MPKQTLALAALLIAGCATTAGAGARGAPRGVVDLEVDLAEAPRRLFHSKMTLPVRPGPLALVYPKWLPGEHGPTGPLTDLAGLVVRAGDQVLPWTRDPVELHEVRVVVPEGASTISISLDYLGSPLQDGFSSGASATARLAILNWNQVLLYPRGAAPAELSYRASLRVPAGWKTASALQSAGRDGDKVSFEPVSLETLIDSPVQLGAHLIEVPLGDNHGAPMSVAIAAETEADLRARPEMLVAWKKLVAEEAALFGARHFDSYRWLLTLSDSISTFGLEHHQSSDDRVQGRALVDKELSQGVTHLLAHESVHSWNGKYRRPAGLATADYQAPMQGELLWVYEGLTQYLGTILTARSGAWDAQTLRDHYALTAEDQRNTRGRTSRPVGDTAVAAQLLYGSRDGWAARRRSVDFYDEGDLIWLEVDLLIREKSGGKKSLDDFCRAFHGGKSTGPMMRTYVLGDVIAGLNEVVAADWKALLLAHIDSRGEDAPLEGLRQAGYRLDYSDRESDYQKSREKSGKRIDVRSSIGVLLDAEKNTVVDVIPGKPADLAGLAPAMKVIGVNGRKYSAEILLTAIEETRRGTPLELLVENADTYQSFKLDYSGGAKYPRLSPIEGKPDRLGEVSKPLSP